MANHDRQTGVSIGPSSEMAEVVESCNCFAFDLHSKLATKPGNLFFSPSSISMALAMTLAGASEDTSEEMAEVLHSTLPENRFHEGFWELRKATRTEGVELKLANRLWGQRGFNFLPEFLEATERCYGARLAEVDFRAAAEDARLRINAWVEEQTARKIKDLIAEGLFTPLTRLVLTNAIYFKGNWEYAFYEHNTSEGPFWTEPGKAQPVQVMRQTELLRYGEFENLQVLELPYLETEIEFRSSEAGVGEVVKIPDSGSDLAMCILLPRPKDGLAKVESRLTTATFQEWTTLHTCVVEASIPKFRIESSFLLNEALESLGMRQAFSSEEADFSRMSDDPEGLFLAAALHKAFVDVNEKGTEAAAATAVVMAWRGGPPEQPKVFRADRPFLFLIRDRTTRLIHFVGRVVNPKC
jgi:serpin B